MAISALVQNSLLEIRRPDGRHGYDLDLLCGGDILPINQQTFVRGVRGIEQNAKLL